MRKLMPVSAAASIAVMISMAESGRGETDAAEPVYHSPFAVAASPRGGLMAVSDFTHGQVVTIDPATAKLSNRVALRGQPAGLDWNAGGGTVYVAERGAGTVAEVDVAKGAVTRRIEVGRYPMGVAAAGNRLIVANSGLSSVSIVDLAAGAEIKRIPCPYRPWGVAVTPDGGTAVVSNLQPAGDARDPTMSAAVSLVDVAAGAVATNIALPPGSINLRGVAISPDGNWAYVAHSVGRFTLPTTQLERGWVMTHAMSIVDLQAGAHYTTVLLDLLMEGGADPWQIALDAEGRTAWITLSGVGQLARLDLALLHALLEGKADKAATDRLAQNSIWHQIAKDPSRRGELINDLAALYASGVLERHEIGADGPRGIALSADGARLAVADYFGGAVALLASDSLQPVSRVALGDQPPATQERLGEQHFFDARLCFQHWVSCASCHPEGRADGLNWDLLNDGIGNPKNTKSLVLSHRTPPVMSTGVRPDMDTATEKGFMFIQFRVVDEATMGRVRNYLRSLRPEPSPYLRMSDKKLSCVVCHAERPKARMSERHMPIDGELTPEAEKGMNLFKDKEVGCIQCHPGPLFTDLKMYDVGTRGELDRRDDFDNPTCYEMWRTAPFLHDGAAPTLRSMLTELNKNDKHGKTSHLSDTDVEALAAYLRSL